MTNEAILQAASIPPLAIPMDDETALARFLSADFGVVLWVERNEQGFGDTVYEQYIDVVLRRGGHSWGEEAVSAGSGWADQLCDRSPDLNFWMSGLTASFMFNGRRVSVTSGIAGCEVRTVRNAASGEFVVIGGPDAPHGAFVIPLSAGDELRVNGDGW